MNMTWIIYMQGTFIPTNYWRNIMFGSLLKAAVCVVTAPVAVVADVVTLGGTMNDRKETYTESQLKALVKNVENAVDPDKK